MTRHLFTISLLLCAGQASAQIAEIPDGLETLPISADTVATVRTALPEARAVNAEFLDPSYDPSLPLSQDASVTVTFIDEGAGYRNSLAWVALADGALEGLQKQDIDADSSGNVSLAELGAVPGVEYGLVFPNASRLGGGGLLVPGDSVAIDGGRVFSAGTTIVFCVLQNAWKNGTVNGYSESAPGALSMYASDMLNPEAPADADLDTDSVAHKSRHVAMLFATAERDQILMGFEDLHRKRNSDEDFNDTVLMVTSTPPEALQDADIAEADPGFGSKPEDLFLVADCCGIDTTDILGTELPERTNVQAEFLDPSYDPTLTISDTTLLALSFIGEGAIYKNSLGYFTYTDGALDDYDAEDVDADGDGIVEPFELRAIPGVETGMVFANSSAADGGGTLLPRETVFVGDREFDAGTRVGFFLIQDGWTSQGLVRDFIRDTGQDTLAFYTIDRFNPEPDPDARRHAAMLFTDGGRNQVLFGFEDLHRTDREQNPARYISDEDFNDTVFCIRPVTIGAVADTNIPVAGIDCPADLDNSDHLDLEDLKLYLQAWLALDLTADFNDDGIADLTDLGLFINMWLNGCDG